MSVSPLGSRGIRGTTHPGLHVPLSLFLSLPPLSLSLSTLPRMFVLLTFGLQLLRKAILRAGGFVALHDEDRVFQRERHEAERAGRDRRFGMDWYSFVLSFKGVLLEGLEVAFIVITFGSTQGDIGLAAAAAAAALVLVALAGILLRSPLSRVPENTMKFSVGIMLTTFGIYWGTEGTSTTWPGGDLALPGVLAFVTACSLALVRLSRRQHAALALGAQR